jgi:hypothetical protein
MGEHAAKALAVRFVLLAPERAHARLRGARGEHPPDALRRGLMRYEPGLVLLSGHAAHPPFGNIRVQKYLKVF